MEDFNGWLIQHQIEWRRKNIPYKKWGMSQKGMPHEWILPEELGEDGLWSGIRTGQRGSVSEYITREGIDKHRDAHNLTSSWTQCANLYFPFGQTEYGRQLFAGFLKAHISSHIETLDVLDLEYEGPGDLCPKRLLGEKRGHRGSRQTSPDIGLLVNSGRGLILVENKLKETNFEPCSGLDSRKSHPNPRPERCKNPFAGLNAADECHQHTWGRKYWDYLAPVVDIDAFVKLRCCPAAGAGYQLLRQQALAEGIAKSGEYDFVVSGVAMDFRNETLLRCLEDTGLADVRDWGELFDSRAQFRVWDHQQWVTWVQEHDGVGKWSNWLEYVKSRYGYV